MCPQQSVLLGHKARGQNTSALETSLNPSKEVLTKQTSDVVQQSSVSNSLILLLSLHLAHLLEFLIPHLCVAVYFISLTL